MSPATTSTAATQREVLGHGLALAPVSDGGTALDLVWRVGPDGRALGLVVGADNLAQDLAVALLTPLGSDPFDTAFGFDGFSVLALGVGAALAQELLRLSVVRTLIADGRVAEVTDVTVEPLGLDRRQVVRATVRTVLGQDLPMTLGEVQQP